MTRSRLPSISLLPLLICLIAPAAALSEENPAGSLAPDAAPKTIQKLTTLDGQTFTNVKLVSVPKGAAASLSCAEGIIVIPLEKLPDDALAAFGLPTHAQITARIAAKKKEQEEFEQDQANRGLVKYKNLWIPIEEKKRLEADEWADKMTEAKSEKNVAFTIRQALTEGCFCASAPDGPTFFLYGTTNQSAADGDKYKSDLFWAGTYTYITVNRTVATVNSYAMSRDAAREILKKKFHLDAEGFNQGTVPELPDSLLSGKTFGSGFVVTDDGYIITNNHVVQGGTVVRVKTEQEILPAKVVAADPDVDLALIKVSKALEPVTFSSEKSARLGQTVFTVGFPLPAFQGFSPKVTRGVISGLKGMQDDARRYQIDATVQPGNSGGPLADECGDIVGVVVGKLLVPGSQNVNYTIKLPYVLAILDGFPEVANRLRYDKEGAKLSFEDAVEKVRKATVMVVAQ